MTGLAKNHLYMDIQDKQDKAITTRSRFALIILNILPIHVNELESVEPILVLFDRSS